MKDYVTSPATLKYGQDETPSGVHCSVCGTEITMGEIITLGTTGIVCTDCLTEYIMNEITLIMLNGIRQHLNNLSSKPRK